MIRNFVTGLALCVFLMGLAATGAPPALTVDIPDLTKLPDAKKLLDRAADELKKYAQGNEGGVSVKSASAKNVTFDLKTLRPVSGTVTVVFDVHHRHRTWEDGKNLLGIKLPGVVAYDRHDEVLAEYDLKERRGRARIAKGPLGLPLLPKIDWDLWINIDLKDK
jgi:hypothetical protein